MPAGVGTCRVFIRRRSRSRVVRMALRTPARASLASRDARDARATASATLARRRAVVSPVVVSLLASALAPAASRADALSASVDALSASVEALDPWVEARRVKASARASRMRRVDAAATAEREARRAEDERARATYAEFAAKKKTRIRLEREGELSEAEIEREVARAGEMARANAERGVAAEEAELAAFEELMAERRREAAARAAAEAVNNAP